MGQATQQSLNGDGVDMNAPITEEDKPAIEAMIRKLQRYRKREHAQGKKWINELDDAIKNLHDYGALKSWWEFES